MSDTRPGWTFQPIMRRIVLWTATTSGQGNQKVSERQLTSTMKHAGPSRKKSWVNPEEQNCSAGRISHQRLLQIFAFNFQVPSRNLLAFLRKRSKHLLVQATQATFA